MTIVGLIGTIAQIVLVLLQEWSKKRDGNAEAVEELQKKRVDLHDAIANGRTGWISSVSYNRAARLRMLLEQLPPKGSTPGDVSNLQSEGGHLPPGGNSGSS